MKEILDIIHKTIYQFFDVCEDDEEVPISDKDKLLLEVNKAICNNLKALEPKWIPVSERLPEEATNGDMIQAMFPYGEYGTNGNEVHVFGVGGNGCLVFTLDWWNAPYKVESEDKK